MSGQWNHPLFSTEDEKGVKVRHDFRYLNCVLTWEEVPSYKIFFAEFLKTLQNSKPTFISKIVLLEQGENKIQISPDTKPILAFTVQGKRYQPNVLPKGIANFPKTIHDLLKNLVQQKKWSFCQSYLWEMYIYSKNEEEHKNHLKEVINALTEINMTLSKNESMFGRNSISLFGNVINLKEENGVNFFPVYPNYENVERSYLYSSFKTFDHFLYCFGLVPWSKEDVKEGNLILDEFEKQPLKLCSKCYKDGKMKLCGKCEKVYYCSRECQEKDWASHKKICFKVKK